MIRLHSLNLLRVHSLNLCKVPFSAQALHAPGYEGIKKCVAKIMGLDKTKPKFSYISAKSLFVLDRNYEYIAISIGEKRGNKL